MSKADSTRTAAEESVRGLLPGDDPQGHPMHHEPNKWAHTPHSELRAAYEASTDADEARAIMHAMQLQQLQHRGGC